MTHIQGPSDPTRFRSSNRTSCVNARRELESEAGSLIVSVGAYISSTCCTVSRLCAAFERLIGQCLLGTTVPVLPRHRDASRSTTSEADPLIAPGSRSDCGMRRLQPTATAGPAQPEPAVEGLHPLLQWDLEFVASLVRARAVNRSNGGFDAGTVDDCLMSRSIHHDTGASAGAAPRTGRHVALPHAGRVARRLVRFAFSV